MKNITSIATLGNGRYESGFFIIVSTMNYLVEHSEVNISLKLKMDNPTYADIELPISVDRMMFFSPSVDDGGSISFDPKYDVIKTFNYLNEEPVLMSETSADLSSGIIQESAMYGRYVKSSVVSSRGVYSVMPIEIGVNQLTEDELIASPTNIRLGVSSMELIRRLRFTSSHTLPIGCSPQGVRSQMSLCYQR